MGGGEISIRTKFIKEKKGALKIKMLVADLSSRMDQVVRDLEGELRASGGRRGL